MQISEMIDRILRCFGDQSSQSPPEASSSGLVDRGIGCDVFIVDDEPELRRMIVSALGQLQRSPKEFAGAKDLVAGLEVEEPKLIFWTSRWMVPMRSTSYGSSTQRVIVAPYN